ncbi:hypothetical protein GCM10020295_68250 [Streptomyces cinereospinus]
MVVTLFVALGIGLVQGCQGASRGLGDERGGVRERQEQVREQMRPAYRPADEGTRTSGESAGSRGYASAVGAYR